jgi:hypothetical protein
MSNLSRRTLISSAAALPALAVPALALAHNPDAVPALGAVDHRIPTPTFSISSSSTKTHLRKPAYGVANLLGLRKGGLTLGGRLKKRDPRFLESGPKIARFCPNPILNPGRSENSGHDVEQLRKEKWSRVKNVTIEPTDLVAVVEFVKRHEFLYEVYMPTPEARARADDIIQAHDRWYAGYNKVPRGFRAAERRQVNAIHKQDELGRKIAATKTLTIAGMKAKMRCIAMESKNGKVKDLDDDHWGIAVSIMRDLTALAA